MTVETEALAVISSSPDVVSIDGSTSKNLLAACVEHLKATAALRLPKFVRNGSDVPIGLSDSTNTLPIISKPVEVLASSAVASACVSTAADEVLASFTIPAGTLGVNSHLQITPVWSFTNSANNKIIKVKIGATVVYTATRTASAKEGPLVVLANRNSLSSQVQPYDNAYFTAGSGAVGTFTINFSIAQTIQITGQRANGADSLTLEYFRILHFVGD